MESRILSVNEENAGSRLRDSEDRLTSEFGKGCDPVLARKELLQLVYRECYSVEKPFRLASGQVSDYYVDGKMVELDARALLLYAVVLWDLLKDEDFNSISGLMTGSIPLTAAAVIGCFVHGNKVVEGSFVRSSRKDHGTQKMLEGKLPGENAKVVVLDDVVTTGSSVMDAIDELERRGATVVKVISLVDRADSDKNPRFPRDRYLPIFTSDELRAIYDEAHTANSIQASVSAG